MMMNEGTNGDDLQINEELIYSQMYDSVLEEIYLDDPSPEDTPNLKVLEFSKEQIAYIRKAGIQGFKEIIQQRFRQDLSIQVPDIQIDRQNNDNLNVIGEIKGNGEVNKLLSSSRNQVRNDSVNSEYSQNEQQDIQRNNDQDSTPDQGGSDMNTNNNHQKQNKLHNNNNEKKRDIFGINGIVVSSYKSINDNNNSNQIDSLHNISNYNKDNTSAYHNTSNNCPSSVQDIYRRHQQSQQKIEKMREDQNKQEYLSMSNKVRASQTSQKLLKKQNYIAPQQKALTQQKQKIDHREKLNLQNKETLLQRELEECTFQPKINNMNTPKRSIGQFLQSQQTWEEQKKNHITSHQQEQSYKEMSSSTFKPQINQYSDFQARDIPVEEKLVRDLEKTMEKIKQKAQEQIPKFQPNILAKSKVLAAKRKEQMISQVEEEIED